MNRKIIPLILIGLLVFSTLALANTSISTSTSSLILSNTNNMGSFLVSNDGTDEVELSYDPSLTIEQNGNIATFNLASNDSSILSGGSQAQIDVEFTGNTQDFSFGTHSVSSTITATNTSDNTLTSTQDVDLRFESTFCDSGSAGGSISLDIDVENEDGHDDQWRLLDNVIIEVDVENDGSQDLDDVVVEIGLFDSQGNDFSDDLDFNDDDDEKRDLGDIDDGDEERMVFNFRVPADFDDGNYKLAIKAYSDDDGESNQCTDRSTDLSNNFYEEIEIERESDDENFIVIENLVYPTDNVLCGESFTIDMDVFNIGDEGDENQIKVELYNNELDLYMENIIREDLEEGDDAHVSFTVDLSQGLENKYYQFKLKTYYNYRSSSDHYRTESEETWTAPISVSNCISNSLLTGNAFLTASLDSEVLPGEELLVSSSITNQDSELKTFVLEAANYDSWAELRSITPTLVTLEAGETKSIDFVFKLSEKTEGLQSFTMQARNALDNSLAEEIEIEVKVAEKEKGLFGKLFEGKDGNLIWLIGAINVILILLIIMVATRLSRK